MAVEVLDSTRPAQLPEEVVLENKNEQSSQRSSVQLKSTKRESIAANSIKSEDMAIPLPVLKDQPVDRSADEPE